LIQMRRACIDSNEAGRDANACPAVVMIIHTYIHTYLDVYTHTQDQEMPHLDMGDVLLGGNAITRNVRVSNVGIYTHIHTYLHICIYSHTHTHIHTYLDVFTHTQDQEMPHLDMGDVLLGGNAITCVKCWHIYVHTQIHTYLHICIYSHTHTHIFTRDANACLR
jgi:hypothetical protein